MVILHATFRVKPEMLESALEHCNTVLGPSRSEPGCASYSFYCSPSDPCEMIFVEEWKSADALREHFRMPHVLAFFASIPDFVANDPVIKIFEAELTEL